MRVVGVRVSYLSFCPFEWKTTLPLFSLGLSVSLMSGYGMLSLVWGRDSVGLSPWAAHRGPLSNHHKVCPVIRPAAFEMSVLPLCICNESDWLAKSACREMEYSSLIEYSQCGCNYLLIVWICIVAQVYVLFALAEILAFEHRIFKKTNNIFINNCSHQMKMYLNSWIIKTYVAAGSCCLPRVVCHVIPNVCGSREHAQTLHVSQLYLWLILLTPPFWITKTSGTLYSTLPNSPLVGRRINKSSS